MAIIRLKTILLPLDTFSSLLSSRIYPNMRTVHSNEN
jgi:hypothetical protein